MHASIFDYLLKHMESKYKDVRANTTEEVSAKTDMATAQLIKKLY